MRRHRKAKIIATLGPGLADEASIGALFEAGADVFRLNYSHGNHDDHAERHAIIRKLEKKYNRPIAVLADLQGPKLRIGRFANDKIHLKAGQAFRLDLDSTLGDSHRVHLPHPEIFEALEPGADLLLDDGRVRLRIKKCSKDFADCEVITGNALSNNKGVNVPSAVLNVSPITDKDRKDLNHALSLGVDWIALSFVQRPDDIAEAKKLVQGRAGVLAKLEKPSAIEHLHDIVELSDAVMVARGDLGVELPPEDVPSIQKRIVNECRLAGKPVVIATQMLESMVTAPTPTRAEASDVATAIYDGADAVMLSAETAVGDYPVEAVTIMNRIIARTEADPICNKIMEAERGIPRSTAEDAISQAARQVAQTISAAAIVAFTATGSTTLRAARERPNVPIVGLTPNPATARRLCIVWGVHATGTKDISTFREMVSQSIKQSKKEGFAEVGERIVITAGVPFGTPGATNILRIAWVD